MAKDGGMSVAMLAKGLGWQALPRQDRGPVFVTWVVYAHCRDRQTTSGSKQLCGLLFETFLSSDMCGRHFEEMKIRKLVLISNLPFSQSLWEMMNFLCNRFTIQKKMGVTLTVVLVSKVIVINMMIDIKMPFQKHIINLPFPF